MPKVFGILSRPTNIMFLSRLLVAKMVISMVLLLTFLSKVSAQCGKPCNSITDCPDKMTCNPDQKCDDSPNNLVLDPPLCPMPGCNPSRSFVYTGPTPDQDHCFTNQTYQLYSCSPPVNRDRNFGILYYFDLVNEGIAKCDKKHYAATELVVAMSTGWFARGRHCFENVTITARNGRSVVAKVVDECVSTDGCTKELYFYGPCSPKALSGTTAVWEALGQNISIGIIDITWNFTSPSSFSDKRTSKSKIVIACSVAAGSCALLIVAALTFLFFRKSRTRSNLIGDDMEKTLTPRQFRYTVLHAATGGFETILGEGGYGPVFKGKLPGGTLIAVKRVKGSSHHGIKQFKAEVMSVGSIHHLNLVKLLGFSIRSSGRALLLVYEFVSNGSLDKWIFNKTKYLPWKTRVSIALDVARGLDYLHSGCRETIIHLDIKPQNILLNEKMTAKIADFGFAKLLQKDKSHTMTVMRGTRGYMAPEWLQSRVTDKTDVFSYGVLLLELVFCERYDDTLVYKVEEVIDTRLLKMEEECGFQQHQYERLTNIGFLCIREDPEERPSMGNVVKWIEESFQELTLPEALSATDSNPESP